MKLLVFVLFNTETCISWTVGMNVQMTFEWVDGVIASQFSINFVHRNYKNSIFQLWESKTCHTSTLSKFRMFALIYFDMGTNYMFEQKNNIQNIGLNMENCEVKTSSTHSFEYSYQLFKKCLDGNQEIQKFHIFIFYPILN